jgi:hypothetical protein
MLLPVFELIRLEEDHQYGTFGVLKIAKSVFCTTLEPFDRLNAPDISCIPAGQYFCRRVDSPKFGHTFEITGVTNRDHVLFHPGNRVEDTRGCVVMGQYFGKLKGDRAVLRVQTFLR